MTLPKFVAPASYMLLHRQHVPPSWSNMLYIDLPASRSFFPATKRQSFRGPDLAAGFSSFPQRPFYFTTFIFLSRTTNPALRPPLPTLAVEDPSTELAPLSFREAILPNYHRSLSFAPPPSSRLPQFPYVLLFQASCTSDFSFFWHLLRPSELLLV